MNKFIFQQLELAREIRQEREKNINNNTQDELRQRLFDSRDNVRVQQDAILKIDKRNRIIGTRYAGK